MIFKKKKYKLPNFPEHVIPTFKQLALEPLPLENIAAVKQGIAAYFGKLEELSAKHHQINIDLARTLAERSNTLLDMYGELGERQRKLAAGAVLYYMHYDDPLSDMTFGSGFDDDAKVMNHVLEELGLDHLCVNAH